jgi:hypothetical protein
VYYSHLIVSVQSNDKPTIVDDSCRFAARKKSTSQQAIVQISHRVKPTLLHPAEEYSISVQKRPHKTTISNNNLILTFGLIIVSRNNTTSTYQLGLRVHPQESEQSILQNKATETFAGRSTKPRSTGKEPLSMGFMSSNCKELISSQHVSSPEASFGRRFV